MLSSLTPDYHVHTPFCGHAQGETEEYVKNAVAIGLEEICFCDHLDRYYLSAPQKRRHMNWGIPQPLLHEYLEEVDTLKQKYNGAIRIKKGLEIDYVKGYEEMLLKEIQGIDLDFRLGSIHCLPELGWKHPSLHKDTDPLRIIELYFQNMCSAAESSLFDSIAHPLYILRHLPETDNIDETVKVSIKEFIDTAAEHNTPVEINSKDYLFSCRRKNNHDNTGLFRYLLETISERGVRITIGSDAHAPTETGIAFHKVGKTLLDNGIRECCSFTNRNRSLERITQEP